MEGKSRELWSHTSHVLEKLANANRDTESCPDPFDVADFNPWSIKDGKERERAPSKVKVWANISALRTAFIDKRLPQEVLAFVREGGDKG